RAVGNPARDRRDLGVRKPPLADELAVSRQRLPWRHGPLLHRREDLVAPPVDVLVLDQLEGRAPAGPGAFLAVLLARARDVLIEGHAGRGGRPARRGRSGAAGQNAEQDEEEPEPHAGILRRGGRDRKACWGLPPAGPRGRWFRARKLGEGTDTM